MQFRVGLGQDSHKVKTQNPKPETRNFKPLILAGVIVDKNLTCEANSDGDVVLHALCNALSSACGGPSLSFFADPLCKKGIIDSAVYVKEVLKFVRKSGFKINNVSFSIEAGKPRLEKFRAKIQKNTAKLLKIKQDCVGITCTSGEKLTAFGKGEGIQVFCLVSLVK